LNVSKAKSNRTLFTITYSRNKHQLIERLSDKIGDSAGRSAESLLITNSGPSLEDNDHQFISKNERQQKPQQRPHTYLHQIFNKLF